MIESKHDYLPRIRSIYRLSLNEYACCQEIRSWEIVYQKKKKTRSSSLRESLKEQDFGERNWSSSSRSFEIGHVASDGRLASLEISCHRIFKFREPCKPFFPIELVHILLSSFRDRSFSLYLFSRFIVPSYVLPRQIFVASGFRDRSPFFVAKISSSTRFRGRRCSSSSF